MKKYYCKNCNKPISITSGAYGSGLCKSCMMLYRYKTGQMCKPITNLIGCRFGHLTIIGAFQQENNRIAWVCKCDCGNYIKGPSYNLKSGNLKSCGCQRFKKGKEHHLWRGGRTKEKLKNNELKHLYNINLKTYKEMLKNQNNKCFICNQKETRKNFKTQKIKMLSVDHDHKNNKVRSLLCTRCNTVLGLMNEDIFVLRKMINYIKKFK